MTIQANAVYVDGSLQLEQPLPLAEGAKVRIAIQTADAPKEQAAPMLDPLAQVLGIGDGPAAGDVAAHHDEYLYGTP
jgi:predicted DNA-binding antitoxin AbrB/MazE fold protein